MSMRYINKGGDFCKNETEAATSYCVAKFDFHKPKVRILQKENERYMEPLQIFKATLRRPCFVEPNTPTQ